MLALRQVGVPGSLLERPGKSMRRMRAQIRRRNGVRPRAGESRRDAPAALRKSPEHRLRVKRRYERGRARRFESRRQTGTTGGEKFLFKLRAQRRQRKVLSRMRQFRQTI